MVVWDFWTITSTFSPKASRFSCSFAGWGLDPFSWEAKSGEHFPSMCPGAPNRTFYIFYLPMSFVGSPTIDKQITLWIVNFLSLQHFNHFLPSKKNNLRSFHVAFPSDSCSTCFGTLFLKQVSWATTSSFAEIAFAEIAVNCWHGMEPVETFITKPCKQDFHLSSDFGATLFFRKVPGWWDRLLILNIWISSSICLVPVYSATSKLNCSMTGVLVVVL